MMNLHGRISGRIVFIFGRLGSILPPAKTERGTRMNILSCDRCGIVLDLSKMSFPAVFDHDTVERIEGNSDWVDGRLLPKTECPVCGGIIYDLSYEQG